MGPIGTAASSMVPNSTMADGYHTKWKDENFQDPASLQPGKVQSRPESRRKRLTRFVRSWSATQCALVAFGAFLIVWAIVVSVLLLLIPLRYMTSVVAADRTAYLVSGAAAWARAEAARELMGTVQVRDALRAALRSDLLQGSWDTTTLEQVLAPVFSTVSCLHEVELIFADTFPAMTVVGTSRNSGSGALELNLRSNAENCYLFGAQGCLNGPVPPSVAPSWHFDALNLVGRASAVAAENAAVVVAKRSAGRSDGTSASKFEVVQLQLEDFELGDDAGAWEQLASLSLLPEQSEAWAVETWLPSYRLIFRLADPSSAFPSEGPYAQPALVGRIAAKVGSLSGTRLQDERLGNQGRVHLVDRAGFVLASHDPMELLAVDPSGRMRLKTLTEVSSAGGFAAAVIDELGKGKDAEVQQGGGHIAISFLPPPLEHFAVVASAPSQEPFRDGSMYATSITCLIFAALPYISGLAFSVAVVVDQRVARRAVKEFNLDNSDDDDEDLDTAAATLANTGPRRSSIVRIRASAIRNMDTLRGNIANLSLAKQMAALEAEALGKTRLPDEGVDVVADVSDELALANSPQRGNVGADSSNHRQG